MRTSSAAKPEAGVDRRKHERVDAHLIVEVAEHHAVDKQTRSYLEEIAENVSLGGLFIRTARPFSKGTSLRLNLRLASDGESAPKVRANAIVRWVRSWGATAGMGVEFLDFELNGRRDLDRFLEIVKQHPEVRKPTSRRAR